jgi:hypothetical protein
LGEVTHGVVYSRIVGLGYGEDGQYSSREGSIMMTKLFGMAAVLLGLAAPAEAQAQHIRTRPGFGSGFRYGPGFSYGSGFNYGTGYGVGYNTGYGVGYGCNTAVPYSVAVPFVPSVSYSVPAVSYAAPVQSYCQPAVSYAAPAQSYCPPAAAAEAYPVASPVIVSAPAVVTPAYYYGVPHRRYGYRRY